MQVLLEVCRLHWRCALVLMSTWPCKVMKALAPLDLQLVLIWAQLSWWRSFYIFLQSSVAIQEVSVGYLSRTLHRFGFSVWHWNVMLLADILFFVKLDHLHFAEFDRILHVEIVTIHRSTHACTFVIVMILMNSCMLELRSGTDLCIPRNELLPRPLQGQARPGLRERLRFYEWSLPRIV